jgi:lipoprotein-anchoring transpeptidase ErfK/SrfK
LGVDVRARTAEDLAAKGRGRAVSGWLRLLLAASAAVMALNIATDGADARSLRRAPDKRQAEKKDLPAPAAKGQLLIAVSIGSQRLTVYDDGVPIAHSPVSSGTAGHPTPTGVFSIIQKNRHHRSNIYSGAPMPFMQRITWSGVALHAGVLPGYPASHGCIRLPGDFAARLWGMTKLGARVIVSRHDVTPVAISHARLTLLQTPVLAAATEKRADLLRPGIGIEEPATPVVATAVRTADASAGTVANDASATVSPPAAEPVEAAAPPAAPPAATAPDAAASLPSVQAAPTSIEAVPATTAADAAAPQTPAAEVAGPAAADAAAGPAVPPNAVSTVAEPAPPAGDEAKAVARPTEAPAETETTSAIDLALPSAVPATAMPASVSTDRPVSPSAASPASPVADPTMLAALPIDEVFVPPERPARPLRAGPISVFISRKDARLYIRKRFDPLFSVPVAIRADQPIGTHVYTAAEGDGGVGLRWIATSLPAELPKASKPDRRPGAKADTARGKAIAVPAVPAVPAPSTAAEALDRVDLSAEVVAQIAGLMSPGASIIISDQGLGYETGLETDFIVLSR